jgi:EAL domain-containing protein (putative c-di-GMP-specific phosphodiesterase class I)
MTESPAPNSPWVLVGLLRQGDTLSTVELQPLPFRVGRRPGLQLTLAASSVSSEHAELYVDGDVLHVRDLGSTNGTFVNRVRVQDQALTEGDVIHFAEFEFRLSRDEQPSQRRTVVMTQLPLPQAMLRGARELRELLQIGAVTMVFQPIVALPNAELIGYEALGRGRYPGLPESPLDLFQIAAGLGVEAELSRLFRTKAVELVSERIGFPNLFLNTHPAELGLPGLSESIDALRRRAPELVLTLEIHEAAIVKVAHIGELRKHLQEFGIGLAYDDFGAGQARLLELGEVPPDLLKFDARFVRGLDTAPDSKRRLLRSLVTIAKDLGVEPLAEGVETAAEAEACLAAGFTRAQGYHFGRPAPLPPL